MDNLIFRYMTVEDLPQIMLIEQDAFSIPWTIEAFHNELTNNRLAHYMAVELDGEVIGYGGLWIIVDEAHITNIAIHSSQRGKGLGKRLVKELINTATTFGATKMTLEVRVKNVVAQHVYKQFGFVEAGIRPKYYEDNNEDALIMWADIEPINDERA
jgi:[ribosomal protein S18]-alanine N-acetyltransferase